MGAQADIDLYEDFVRDLMKNLFRDLYPQSLPTENIGDFVERCEWPLVLLSVETSCLITCAASKLNTGIVHL